MIVCSDSWDKILSILTNKSCIDQAQYLSYPTYIGQASNWEMHKIKDLSKSDLAGIFVSFDKVFA